MKRPLPCGKGLEWKLVLCRLHIETMKGNEMTITVKELRAILQTLPDGAIMPIVRGRREPEIYCSIPIGIPLPYGWEQATAGPGMYPEGTIRIRWKGLG